MFFSSRQSPWIGREFWPFWPMPFLWLFFSLRFFWFVLLPFRLSRSVEDALHPMTQEEVLHGTQDSPEVFHKSSGLSIDYSSFNVKRRRLSFLTRPNQMKANGLAVLISGASQSPPLGSGPVGARRPKPMLQTRIDRLGQAARTKIEAWPRPVPSNHRVSIELFCLERRR